MQHVPGLPGTAPSHHTLDINSYRIQIREAALGNAVEETLANRVSIESQENVLKESYPTAISGSKSAEELLGQALASIRNEFDEARNLDLRDNPLALRLRATERQPPPPSSTDAYRNARPWVADNGEAPRQEIVYLLADPNAYRLLEIPPHGHLQAQERVPILGIHGMASLCKRFTRTANGSFIYRVNGGQRFAIVLQVARSEFSPLSLLAHMSARGLGSSEVLEDEHHVYCVCHPADQAGVTLPPPRLRPAGFEADMNPLQLWFRDLVSAIDAAFEGRFILSPGGIPSILSPFLCLNNHEGHTIRALGLVLFECLTGVSFPIRRNTDQLYGFVRDYWINPNGSINLQVPDGVLRILESNFMKGFNNHGPVGSLLELIGAVHAIPIAARDLLNRLLNASLSLEQILRHPFLFT